MHLAYNTPVLATGTVLSTAEPLRGDRRAIASFFGDREDCERVTACVNACLHISTESLGAPIVNELLRALVEADSGKKVLVGREEYDRLKAAAQALADAAGYINCRGSLSERLHVLLTEHGLRVARMEEEIERLCRALGFYATPENWVPGDDEDSEAAIDSDTDEATVDLFLFEGCTGKAPVAGARARAALAAVQAVQAILSVSAVPAVPALPQVPVPETVQALVDYVDCVDCSGEGGAR